VTEDLTKFNVIELQQHLAKHGSLPRRNPPGLPPRKRIAPQTI
jgi:hypothetical protein